MRHFFSRSLLSLLALAWFVPKADAQEYTISVDDPSDWFKTFTAPGGLYRQAAVADDAFFVAPAYAGDGSEFIAAYYSAGYRIDEANGAKSFSYGSWTDPDGNTSAYYCAGPGIASDTYGNLYFKAKRHASSTGLYANAGAIGVYTVRPNPTTSTIGTKSIINITSVGARTDRMSAYGDCMNGTGYFWFAPNGSQLERVTVTKGTANTTNTKFAGPLNSGVVSATNAAIVTQYSDTEVLYDQGGAILYKGTISGSTITWSSLGVTNNGSGATMFELGGKEILVYASSTTAFKVRNVTDGVDIVTITPWGSSSVSANSATYFSFNAKVNSDGTAYLYVYTPGQGAARYTVRATAKGDPVTNVVATINENRAFSGRQDAVITWTAPASGTVTSYTVQRRRTYLADATDANTTTAWVTLGTTTNTSYTESNVKWVNSTKHDYVSTDYEYQIIPTYSTGVTGTAAVSNVATPAFIPATPQITEVRNYEGYCKVQLFWSWNSWGCKPIAYDVIRDKNVINVDSLGNDVPLAAFDYVDKTCLPDHDYVYQIQALYPNMTIPADKEYLTYSLEAPVSISYRDWSKPDYSIEEIYNVPLQEITTNYPPIFEDGIQYKQGAFYNDTWYIMQMSTNKGPGADFSSINNTNQDGGVIKFAAYTEADIKKGYTKHYYPSEGTADAGSHHNVSAGVAVDDEGTVFLRGKDSGWTSGTAWGGNRNFEYDMENGLIYTKSGKEYKVKFWDNGIKFGVGGQDPTPGRIPYYSGVPQGRVDYFAMTGKLETDGFCYLYIAPSGTRTVYKIKLTLSGGVVTPTIVAVNEAVSETGKFNNENYAYPVKVAGREDEYIYNWRSVSHTAFKADGTAGNNPSTFSADITLVDYSGGSAADDAAKATQVGDVYNTLSRVNSAGGCTLEFNGEFFIISPQGQFSMNSGNFFVGMAERKTINGVTQKASEANILSIIPAAQWAQNDNVNSAYSDANGLWLHAEVPTIESEMTKLGKLRSDIDADNNGECDYAYIYVYRPGFRFAKYKLIPTSVFPPTQVALDVKPVYEKINEGTDAEENVDILQYNAEATWNQVENYGVNTEQGNKYYDIATYTLKLYDEDGNQVGNTIVVYVDTNGNVTKVITVDANGNQIADITNDPNFSYSTYTNSAGQVCKTFKYVYPDVDAMDPTTGEARDFRAEVQVGYVGVVEETNGQTHNSIITEDDGADIYSTQPPTGSVDVTKREQPLWADWDGDKEGDPTVARDTDDGYWDVWNIELDFEEPVFPAGEEEPVSHYTVTVTGDNVDGEGGTSKEVCEFYLYNTVTGEYDLVTNCQIPGTYPFEDVPDGTPIIKWDEKDYVGGDNPKDTSVLDGDKDPTTWDYIVTAVYASDNAKITKDDPVTIDPTYVGTTAVEVISTSTALSVYPIPAKTVITIKASEAINSVEIYSAAGLLVKAVSCDGDNVMNVAIDDLADGYYFLKVNDNKPVKIVKN